MAETGALTQAAQAHRLVAALVVAAGRAGTEPPALPPLRQRLLVQQATFAEVASTLGVPVPPLAPAPAEIAAAGTALGDLSPAAVADACATAASTLDLTDRLLANPSTVQFAGPTAGPGWPQGEAPPPDSQRVWRNALVYGAYALVVLVMQLIIFLGVSDEETGVLWAPLCALVFPVIAWGAGYLTVGRGPRSARLGAIICFAPNLVFCCGLGLFKLLT